MTIDTEDQDAIGYALFLTVPFPDAEREIALSVRLLLTELAFYVVDFMAVLDLTAYCEMRFNEAVARQDIYGAHGFARQAYVPARDGAMTIYHFGKALGQVRERYGLSPRLRERVFADELKVAWKLFNSQFPHFNEIRNSVAHAAEELGKVTLAQMTSGVHQHPAPQLNARRLRVIHDGKELSYFINDETLEKLNRIKLMALRAFRIVAKDADDALKAGRML